MLNVSVCIKNQNAMEEVGIGEEELTDHSLPEIYLLSEKVREYSQHSRGR